MRNERAWPQQCWKICANGSNIVALRFGDHGTKEMLAVVGWEVWPVSNFNLRNNTQQHPTTWNRVCKQTQHVTSHNAGSCWPTLLRPFVWGFSSGEVGVVLRRKKQRRNNTSTCYMAWWREKHKIFLTLRKRNHVKKNIRKLCINGKITTDAHCILKELERCFDRKFVQK